MIWREEVTIRIGSRRNRSFQWIECLLGFLRAESNEPVPGIFRMRRPHREGEAIDNEHEGASRSRMAHPADVLLSILGQNLAVRPVAHAVEASLALDD